MIKLNKETNRKSRLLGSLTMLAVKSSDEAYTPMYFACETLVGKTSVFIMPSTNSISPICPFLIKKYLRCITLHVAMVNMLVTDQKT
jgi:hypothetical protein